MFNDSKYSAITATALFVFPCWHPSAVWPITMAVLLHCMVTAPQSFFFPRITLPSSSLKNWYFVPSQWTPPDIKTLKSFPLKHLAIFAPSFCCNCKKNTIQLANYSFTNTYGDCSLHYIWYFEKNTRCNRAMETSWTLLKLVLHNCNIICTFVIEPDQHSGS